MTFDINSVSPAELLKLVKKAGGQRAFAKLHGIARTTIQDRLYKLRKQPFSHRPAPVAKKVGDRRGVRRFILSSAQDGTLLNEPFLDNLEAYRDWLQQYGTCEILIAGYTYGKHLFEEHSKASVAWPERIKAYIVSDRIRIADKIDFCGEMNTLPTSENPLSGFHTYTQDRWGIFPHAKVQLVSVPTQKHLPTKQIMTTGSVTLPNYVMKKAGIKASFHHVYAAVLVEIDKDGAFFCRHLIADDKGSFYDLDRHVQNKTVTRDNKAESITPGDIHVAQIDPQVSMAAFGHAPSSLKAEDGTRVWVHAPASDTTLIKALRPKNIFIHDVSDFRARNHHSIGDPHDRFSLYVNGVESVSNELREVAMFLTTLNDNAAGSKLVVVESNHDEALEKWLKTAEYRYDPVNAEFFLEAQLAKYRSIREGRRNFSIFEHVMTTFFGEWDCNHIRFLREDENYIVNGVENANHGHRGANGARGSAAGLKRTAMKQTVGHAHTCHIGDGLYVSGTFSKLDLGYNYGPSSWSHTLVVQYQSGKRSMITFDGPKWCVEIP